MEGKRCAETVLVKIQPHPAQLQRVAPMGRAVCNLRDRRPLWLAAELQPMRLLWETPVSWTPLFQESQVNMEFLLLAWVVASQGWCGQWTPQFAVWKESQTYKF